MRFFKALRRYIKKYVVFIFNFSEIKKALSVVKEQSYFPELQRKKKLNRIMDNLKWVKNYGEYNKFYNLYGLDIENSNPNLYCDDLYFRHSRNYRNKLNMPYSQVPILRDKFLFWIFAKEKGIKVPEVFAVIINGKLYDTQMNLISDLFLKDKYNYFIKDLNGECASYVKKIKNYEEFCNERKHLKGNYIIQYQITQNLEMGKINPNAINTVRIVTVNDNGRVYPLSAVLRVGTKQTENVDNWAKGGLSIGIDNNGNLKKYGFYKVGFGTKADMHPDTKVIFNDFIIPKYDKIVEKVCEAHKHFYNIKTIGWDVAVCDDGIYIIEGNDNWEISLMQICDRPLKEEWCKIVN